MPKPVETTYIDVLLTDIDLGLTFLNVAEATNVRENAQRNYRNAERAYNEATRRLQAVTLTDEMQAVFDDKLSLLRSRLHASRRVGLQGPDATQHVSRKDSTP